MRWRACLSCIGTHARCCVRVRFTHLTHIRSHAFLISRENVHWNQQVVIHLQCTTRLHVHGNGPSGCNYLAHQLPTRRSRRGYWCNSRGGAKSPYPHGLVSLALRIAGSLSRGKVFGPTCTNFWRICGLSTKSYTNRGISIVAVWILTALRGTIEAETPSSPVVVVALAGNKVKQLQLPLLLLLKRRMLQPKVKMLQLELADVQEKEDPRFLCNVGFDASQWTSWVCSIYCWKSPLCPSAISLQSKKHILGHIVRPCSH